MQSALPLRALQSGDTAGRGRYVRKEKKRERKEGETCSHGKPFEEHMGPSGDAGVLRGAAQRAGDRRHVR